MSIYEKTFAASDKTDAILVVDKKKLHVNKALLSYHSDYFKTLFNSDFAEKSMSEIPIEDVKLEEFATLLSLVHKKPITPTESNAETLLQLTDRFLLPSAKSQVEIFIGFSNMDRFKKLKLADKYNLEVLLNNTLGSYKKKEDFKDMYYGTWRVGISYRVKAKLFERFFYLCAQSGFDDVMSPS